MNTKTTIVLLVAALLLGGYIWFVERKVDTTLERHDRARRALRIDPDSVTYLEIQAGELTAVCQKEEDVWRLVEPTKVRLDAGEIEHILYGLEALPRGEVITAEQQAERGLSLADYGLLNPTAVFTWGNERDTLHMEVGRASPLGHALYVKVEGSDDIIATDTNFLFVVPSSLDELRDHRLLHGAVDRTQRVDIRRQGGYLQFSRSAQGRWGIQQPVEARADRDAVASLLQQLYEVRVEEFIQDEVSDVASFGLHEDALQVIIRTEGSDEVQALLLGGSLEKDEDKVYAMLQENHSVVSVNRSIVDALSAEVESFRDRRLVNLHAYQVSHIKVSEGEEFVELLEKGDGVWWVVQPKQFKADAARVKEFLAHWTAARIERFLDKPGTNLAPSEVNEPTRFVALTRRAALDAGEGSRVAGSEDDEVTLLIGKHDVKNNRVVIKPLYEKSAYEVNDGLLKYFSVNPVHYRDREVLSLEAGFVTRLTIVDSTGEQTVEKGDAGRFVAVTEGPFEANESRVGKILKAATRLQAAEFVADNPEDLATYGLDKPQREITYALTGMGSISKTILLGAREKEGGVYAMIRGDDSVFILPPQTRDTLGMNIFSPIVSTNTLTAASESKVAEKE